MRLYESTRRLEKYNINLKFEMADDLTNGFVTTNLIISCN